MTTETGRKRVCVFAGSKVGRRPAYESAASELGRQLAQRGFDMVYGGGGTGLMGAVADAHIAAGGHVIGIIPEFLARVEVQHNELHELRVVSTMHERKQTMAGHADAFVALPGGIGTFEELAEILTWGHLDLHRKPCGVVNVEGYWDPWLHLLEHASAEGFLTRKPGNSVYSAPTATAVLDLMGPI